MVSILHVAGRMSGEHAPKHEPSTTSPITSEFVRPSLMRIFSCSGPRDGNGDDAESIKLVAESGTATSRVFGEPSTRASVLLDASVARLFPCMM
jgi:hypothetical protein